MNAPVPAIKFCGLTRVVDIEVACALAVDYIGLVFAKGSPRRLDDTTAGALVAALRCQSHRPRVVALVRNDDPDRVRELIDTVAPDVLQFHGAESEAFCRQFGLPYWKALGLLGEMDVSALVERSHPSAEALLLDAHAPGAAGGTGLTLDWTRWPRSERRLVLAGGLKPDNVAAAIPLTSPFAVDVSSGIESAPGVKDAEAMQAFVRAVRDDVIPS